jgi:hypothetical protein
MARKKYVLAKIVVVSGDAINHGEPVVGGRSFAGANERPSAEIQNDRGDGVSCSPDL